MLQLDVESVAADGHVRIDGLSGFMFEGDGGAMTPLGQVFTSGRLVQLLGAEVLVIVSARAVANKAGGAVIYWTAEDVRPLSADGAAG